MCHSHHGKADASVVPDHICRPGCTGCMPRVFSIASIGTKGSVEYLVETFSGLHKLLSGVPQGGSEAGPYQFHDPPSPASNTRPLPPPPASPPPPAGFGSPRLRWFTQPPSLLRHHSFLHP